VLNVHKLRSLACLKCLVKLIALLRRERVDILQTFFIDANIFGIVAGALSSVPAIVSSRRDMGYWSTPSIRRVLRMLDPWVDYYLVNSEHVRDHFLKDEKIDPRKMHVIYNGIDLEPFRSVTNSLREQTKTQCGIPLQDWVVGIVANLNRPVKRVDLLVRAAAEVCQIRSDVWFIVVGEGYLRSELMALSRNLGVDKRMFWAGSQKNVIPFL